MCIAAFAWQAHSLYPFLLLLNRDEYFNRPTKPLEWWEGGEILGGRDEVNGGTWLACSKNGKVAFVTNVMELHTLPKAKSRGELPVRFLKGTRSPREFAEMLLEEAHEYNGFNLILADISSKSLVYITNRPKGEGIKIQEVPPGLHVLANAKLDSPWPESGTDTRFCVFICSPEWEHGLSSIFVKFETPLGYYGTRSTAVLTASTNGDVTFYETYIQRRTDASTGSLETTERRGSFQ